MCGLRKELVPSLAAAEEGIDPQTQSQIKASTETERWSESLLPEPEDLQCIELRQTVFSTEGHIFLNSAHLRRQVGYRGDSSSEYGGGGRDENRHQQAKKGPVSSVLDQKLFTCPVYTAASVGA